MAINAYLASLKAIVDRYAAMHFVVSAQIALETRPGDQGYVSGAIIFSDGSRLHWREYLDATNQQIDKLMYTYHYQDASARLVFRYDNSTHRPALVSPEHRHTPPGVEPFAAPSLADVLLEIAAMNQWA